MSANELAAESEIFAVMDDAAFVCYQESEDENALSEKKWMKKCPKPQYADATTVSAPV